MKITFLPMRMIANKNTNRSSIDRSLDNPQNTHVILHRKDEEPKVIIRRASVTYTDVSSEKQSYWINGELVKGFEFADLKDGDILCYQGDAYSSAITGEFVAKDGSLTPFEHGESISSVASKLSDRKTEANAMITGTKNMGDIFSKALQLKGTMDEFSSSFPMYKNIMIKENGETSSKTIIELVAMQDTELRERLETHLLSMSAGGGMLVYNEQKLPFVKRVLSDIETVDGFSLMTEEEQVGQFIEFSRHLSSNKQEHVSDELIELIKESKEYKETLKQIDDFGFGHSETQQFNVLQQVGYLSQDRTRLLHSNRETGDDNIIYNLSDMGAGKTLMTVQAIAMLDFKQLSSWTPQPGQNEKDMHLRLPDKHIIAPTLSVRSSWIDTFKIFYDVEKVNDSTYNLTTEFEGRTAMSTIFVSAFTIKNSMSYVSEKLPFAEDGTYLIIDELHQLAKKTIARTKFFQPGTKPAEIYRTFILSGTLSNLMTSEWFNYMKFMGVSVSDSTPAQAADYTIGRKRSLLNSIEDSVLNIRSTHQRQIDADKFTPENTYYIEEPKMSGIDKEFYTDYGTQIIKTPAVFRLSDEQAEEGIDFESLIEGTYNTEDVLFANPNETDTTNFKLFYELVGSQSITAESSVVAEELFGKRQDEHVSDIIKTKSPLSRDDVEILRTLHHIAEDHSKYKSLSIAKSIHTAVLNLNDGLQKRNVYDIISRAANQNMRFFEYLTTLNLDVLERLPKSNLIKAPKLEETEKFAVLKDILEREVDETHLIVVNDYHAMKTLSEAIGIEQITQAQLKDELAYQETLDDLFEKQSIVVVTQDMIKSSLDLVQANRLVQYQLNSEISDIIQTQNRINRIGQTRETKGYYIATDVLQENLIELFLNSYKNIRVAHKGIVELFVDVTSQINIVNDYLSKAFININTDDIPANEDDNSDDGGNIQLDGKDPSPTQPEEQTTADILDQVTVESSIIYDITNIADLPEGKEFREENRLSQVILIPQNGQVEVIVPLRDNSPFILGTLREEKVAEYEVTEKRLGTINLDTMEVAI